MDTVILVTLAPGSHRTAEENLGLGYLASSLRSKGFIVHILDGWLTIKSLEAVYKEIQTISNREKILFVGVSCYMLNVEDSIKLNRMIKEYDSSILTLAGGFGPSFSPKYFINHGFDFVLKGEGEYTILELAQHLQGETDICNVHNLVYQKDNEIIENEMAPLIEDLDEFSFPSRDTMQYTMDRKSCVNVLTARGCNGNCLFCSVVSFFRLTKGSHWRTRSIQNIVNELEDLYKKGVRYIKFIDDSFIENNRDAGWCECFADEIINRNLNFHIRASVRANMINEEILFHLKRAGFFSFSCGIENGSPSALKRMNKTAQIEDNEIALNAFNKYGYYIQAGFILFDNATTFKELKENYDFLFKYKWIVMKGIFTEMYAAEGTPFTNKMKRDQKIQNNENNYGNNKYEIEDNKVYLVYVALKTWHKHYMSLYDKAIEPLSAPKAVSDEAMKEYHDTYMLIKEIDLNFYKLILEYIEEGKINSYKRTIEFVNEQINLYENRINLIARNVDLLYEKYDLIYDGIENPFLNN